MKVCRRCLIYILILVVLFGCAAPAAWADELEEEETLIGEALENETEELSEMPAELEDGGDGEVSAASVPTDEEKVPEDGASGCAAEPSWQDAGNSSVNILAGGTMLQAGDCFYYVESGRILCRSGNDEWTVISDNARNLNLCGDMLYYTCAEEGIRRVSVSSFAAETVYSCKNIDQLYAFGTVFYYSTAEGVYSWTLGAEEAVPLSAPDAVAGFIPTQYGILYLTGEAFARTVWAGETAAFENVESCYTEGEYLVLCRDGTWQCSLSALFAGDYTLSAYDLRQDEIETTELSLEEQLNKEAAFFESNLYLQNEAWAEEAAALGSDSVSLDGASSVSLDGASSVCTTAQQNALSSGDTDAYNIARRARQQAEVLWTPLEDRYAWGARSYHAERTVTSEDGVEENYFVAGETYQGIPYSQAVANGSSHPDAGYVGWNLSISDFVDAVNDSDSKFYSGYSTYNQKAPYYGTDCAAFVAWAWDLPYRQTCSSLVNFSTKIGNNINQIELGDCLNCTSAHVILVTDIGYDSDGNIVSIEITESTPLIMRVTIYGERLPNKTNSHIRYISSLSSLQTNYLNNGYFIYRRDYSGSVDYTSDPAVPLTEDGWLSVPTLTTEANSDGSKVLVKLSHSSGYAIHYTTDGTEADLDSPVYSAPIELTKTTVIHAMVDYSSSSATGSFQLSYSVEVEQTDEPELILLSGAKNGNTVSSGSVISLASDNASKIYYTTDGTEPTLNSTVMDSEGLKVTKAVTIKAFAVGKSTVRSDIVTIDVKLGDFYTVTASASSGGSISPNGDVKVLSGEDQTFTFTAGTNYKIKDVVVDGKSIGAQSSYKFTDVAENHEISVSFSVSLPFSDVKDGKWYSDAVVFAYTQNLFTGTSSTSFSPTAKMNRGMFVTVLGRFAGQRNNLEGFKKNWIGYSNGTSINIRSSPSISSSVVGSLPSAGLLVTVYSTAKDSSGDTWYKIQYNGTNGYVKAYSNGKYLINAYTGKFKDISGQYYNGYTQWAYMNDLINGTSDSTFSPGKAISRQDICVILYNYLTKYLGKSISEGSSSFKDDSSISSYARTAVHAMANIGIVNGYTSGNFQPKDSASRAEVAAMFMRLYDYLNG